MLGAIFSKKDFRDYKLVCGASSESFPKTFELKFFNNSIVKNQGPIGSCVAHALSTIVEYYDNTQNGNTGEMSTGYIYGNRNTSTHKGEGMIIRDALSAVKLYGDVYKDRFPHNIEVPTAISKFQKNTEKLYEEGYVNRISSYCKLNNEKEIKTILMEGKPVVFAIKWYGDMKVVNGILTTSYINYKGGHCMVIYGWDEKGWKVQNSYGKLWGNKGRCIIGYDMKIREAWGVIDNIKGTNINIKKPFSNKVGKQVAIGLNKIWKIFS